MWLISTQLQNVILKKKKIQIKKVQKSCKYFIQKGRDVNQYQWVFLHYLKSVDSHTVAFLVTSAGQEECLMPEMMGYKMGKTTMDRVKEIAKIGANIGQIISAIDPVVNWGKHWKQQGRK